MASNAESSGLIGVSEIADIADVGPSAVSNWRNRHKDFPKPKLETPSGVLFDLDEVEIWLREEGKISGRIPAERRLWLLLDGFRGDLSIEESVDLIRAALVYFVACERAGEGSSHSGLDIPESLRWSDWYARLGPNDEVGPHLANASREVESRNRVLEGLLEPLFRLDADQPALLQRLALALSIKKTLETGTDPDLLFTLLATERLKRSGKLGAAYTTSGSATELIGNLVTEDAASVFDPATGEGSLLLQISKAANADQISGVELNERAALFARSRFFVEDLPLELRVGDSLRTFGSELPSADLVVCDPPFGVKKWGDAKAYSNPRWVFGEVPPKNSDFAWIQLACVSTAPGGQGYVFTPAGALFRQGLEESNIRQNMIDAGVIEAIITLPPGLGAESSIASALWVLRSPETSLPGHPVLMIAAETLAEGRRSRSALSTAAIHRVASVVAEWRKTAEVHIDDCDVASSVSPDQITETDLSPGKYLDPLQIDLVDRADEKQLLAGQIQALVPVDIDLPEPEFVGPFLTPVETRELGDLADVWNARGVVGKDAGYVDPGTPGSVPVLGYRELSGSLSRSLPEDEIPSRGRQLQQGDVVFAARENGVEARMVSSDLAGAVLGPGAWQARTLNSDALLPEWLYLWILSEQFSSQISRQGFGATGPRMTLKDLSRLRIPLPPLRDQMRLGERAVSLVEASDRAQSVARMARRLQRLDSTLIVSELEGER